MRQLFSVSRLGLVILPGLLVLASGYALAQPAATSTKPMGGCGMMVDGKMVYKDTAGKPCMNMNKPGNSMPNGVTMHSDPAAATKPNK
jgi:hypothetical protein